MTDRIQITLFGLYATGWFADWTYWLAVGWEWSAPKNEMDYLGPVLVGWVAALFWPLHVGMELWRLVLT